MMRTTLAAGLMVLAAACAPATEIPEPQIEAGNAFIMEPPGGRDLTMGGVDLSATGGDFRLVGARSTIAERIEIHTMEMTDGKMRMRKVEDIQIPAGETVQLERGGDHLMMFGIDTIAAGEKHMIELELVGPDAEELVIEVAAAVRGLGE
ncbi:MAG: copper chaperone PCu(A)C [Alphaproteobacteria bacterium]|nr:copper chaperone PCu(A)C [Alphaproteobacteria bacterium]